MKLGVQQLPVALISDAESIQSRAEVSTDAVEEYSAAMQAGASFPPIVVFFDGKTYRIADGLHRYTAAVNHTGTTILADVREGGRLEALLHAVGANAVHGLRRTNKDKVHAVSLLLDEPKCGDWSDRDVAKACAVSHTMVANARRLRSGNGCQPQPYGGGNESRPLPSGGNQSNPLPEPRQRMASVATLPPPVSGVAEIDPELAEAARLEDRIQRLSSDIDEASPRVRRLIQPVLDMVLRRLANLYRLRIV